MKCIKCSNKADYKIGTNPFCSQCFLLIIEKRVRKELRKKKLIKKNDKILVLDDDSHKSKNTIILLESILKDLPCSIKIKRTNYFLTQKIKTDCNKIIIPWNLDDECEYFFKCLFNKKNPEFIGHFLFNGKKHIKLLIDVTEKESITFAKIKSIDFKKSNKKSMVNNFLDKISKNHPETKYSLGKCIKTLKNLNVFI
ncbi:hypothetical protein GF327_04680 [Candidatus Woesearchaeota archaeon]|nr:hypothetical protein [Candidatus Woesearchaeota archaeon]